MLQPKLLFLLTLFISGNVLVGNAQEEGYSIIPKPSSILLRDEFMEIKVSTRILCALTCKKEAEYFADWLTEATTCTFKAELLSELPQNNYILFDCIYENQPLTNSLDLSWLPIQTAKNFVPKADEGYKLNANANCILINANNSSGIFYAIQTMRQMLPANAENGALKLPFLLPAVSIQDEPQFSHRGLLLDCCRHFMSKEFVMKTIDLISQYKMNVLHWHLTEDQGWRIQIDKYPLLTDVGAWRTEADGTRYGGFYTKDDIREIVAYAEARHVLIIPEIELPGHSVAAIAAYPELSCTGEPIPVEHEWGVFKDIYCAGNENTFEFLENVLAEVCELFPSPYIHIGGDEAPKYRWEHCEKCQKRITEEHLKDAAELQTYFIERIAKFLQTKNKRIIGWDEILEGGIPDDALVQSWRGMQGGIDAARAQHFVIMSPTSHCYFDYPLESTDVKEVYSFLPIPDSLTAYEKSFILGGECNMWTEHAPQEQVESKVFPRLIALSEVLWSSAASRNLDDFEKRLEQNYPRLNAQNVDYGFESVPFSLTSKADGDNNIILQLKAANENTLLSYKRVEDGGDTITVLKMDTMDIHLSISKPTTIYVNANWNGKNYPKEMVRSFNPHLALEKSIALSFLPSPYYTGGGNSALVDGAIGTNSFRDGVWQAVNGKNMEAVIDLEEEKEIGSIKSNWFHYGNAWIFRPSHVEYFISSDGKEWKMISDIKATLDEKAPGELITNMNASFEKTKARYVKMTAYNYGSCPTWHDAVGEPSWLFCDEIIVE